MNERALHRCAGMAVPLFSLRSGDNLGIGEIPDLIPLGRWARRMRQRFVQLLPVNESSPGDASPYAAISAFAIDPVYLALREVPDLAPDAHVASVLAVPVAAGSAIPRGAIRDAKLGALSAAWARFREVELAGDGERARAFRAFAHRERFWIADYALFRALKERHGWGSWEGWPRPAAVAARARTELRDEALTDRAAFFTYVQWLLFEQWARVRAELRRLGVALKGDVAFVLRRDSADGWAHEDLFVPGWEVGAPPDDFSASGQKWGLPLYDWPRLRETNFAWWRERIRQAAQLYDLFRIDHVVGLFRTYAMPIDGDGDRRFYPAGEPEQVEQGEAFLAMVREECGPAEPIAEDLGVIPPFVRQALRRHGIPGYKVLRWEREGGHFRDPRTFEALSVATTGTHDTTTTVQWWRDLSPDEREAFARDLDMALGHDAIASGSLGALARRALLGRLYESGSRFAVAPVQDLFGWQERINVPMTIGDGNWNYRLPFAFDERGEAPRELDEETSAIAELVESGRRWSG